MTPTHRAARPRASGAPARARSRTPRELVPGGALERPLEVDSAAVIEGRARAIPCAQCEGSYRIAEHRSAGPGVRAVDVRCERCGVARTLWFRIVSAEPN